MFEGNLSLKLGRFQLDSGPFAFDSTGVTALFGRSGSGKSTLLRAMAGLDRHTRGQLRFHDETWQDGRRALPAERRDIGMVFQHAALLANRTVRGNLDFAARRAPRDGHTGIDHAEIVERTGISPLLNRAVGNLSGGERQRVAIARALVGQPRVLMMDEPLAALDWRAKAELLELFESVIRDLGIPTLLITHAPQEVERLADRVVFMNEGRVERVETLREALGRADSPLFTEEGPVASLEGHLEPVADDPYRLRFVTRPSDRTSGPVSLWLTHDGRPTSNGPRRLRVRGDDVALSHGPVEGISVQNQVACRIERIETSAPGRVAVFLALADGQRLVSEVTSRTVEHLGLEPDQPITALIKSAALMG
ncbi:MULTISPECIES: molybdenum ABC transporter ATP-binding protein [unclassified Guyparkeria]|uniref:molybdenum ABC transporter ATP-binding protein n=1 Tax=unclassified Guyparkeria TaxID=2626246 RepID=UPI0007339A01|nr:MULTISPECIES: molybdenum ABC transporter ATP-binding protein [unclassified Guyparkeria]KTG16879.1 molybdenum ABC transporter ATP-binding protein [Guyparkeria sp. XI15]OAE85913.1 molybdenum ABC transporter ATP-binding protein [Guyparkeria sp. WRN-7]